MRFLELKHATLKEKDKPVMVNVVAEQVFAVFKSPTLGSVHVIGNGGAIVPVLGEREAVMKQVSETVESNFKEKVKWNTKTK